MIKKTIAEKIRGMGCVVVKEPTSTVFVMLKAGANEGASGENAIAVTAHKADIIIGSVAILAANSMLGELTPGMARAIAESGAKKILIPLNRCNLYVAGVQNVPLPHYIENAIDMIKNFMGGN